MANNASYAMTADAIAANTHGRMVTRQKHAITILRAYEERSSLRGLSRTFGVSRNTVTSWLKKSGEAAAVDPDAARTRRRKA
jgi:transposase-like protein